MRKNHETGCSENSAVVLFLVLKYVKNTETVQAPSPRKKPKFFCSYMYYIHI